MINPALALGIVFNSSPVCSQESYSTLLYENPYPDNVCGELNQYTSPILVTSIQEIATTKHLERILLISELEDNWDGNNGSKISVRVIENLILIIDSIPYYILLNIDIQDIFPSPYGTVFIEADKGENEICIEIGNSEMSYYGEINKESFARENIEIHEEQNSFTEVLEKLSNIF